MCILIRNHAIKTKIVGGRKARKSAVNKSAKNFPKENVIRLLLFANGSKMIISARRRRIKDVQEDLPEAGN